MEIEGSTPAVGKKLWNMVRVLFFMLRKGIAKSKIMGEFHMMLKRGKKALVNNLMLNHHYYMTSLTCRDNNNTSFISPRDYEFSCSNTPIIKRNTNNLKHTRFFSNKPSSHYDDVSTFTAVQKVLEILNNENNNNVNSNNSPLPGFGKSPIGRQLRVTDSPFPLKDEGDSQVDVAAEEFIKKFYRDLNLQKSMASLESPYHQSWVR